MPPTDKQILLITSYLLLRSVMRMDTILSLLSVMKETGY